MNAHVARFVRPVSWLWTQLGRIGGKETDSTETRALKTIISFASVVGAINALYFGQLYYTMGLRTVAVSLLGFGFFFVVNLVAFGFHRKLERMRFWTFLFIYLQTVTYHILLGGYIGSSGYIDYGIVVLVGVHLFYTGWQRFVWYFVYLATAIVLYFLEPVLASSVALLPREFRTLAFVNDFVVIATIIFFAVGIFAKRIREERSRISQAYSELDESYELLQSTQAQLVHAEKMASLGRLTAGVAHEMKNPLNFVNNFADVNMEMIDGLLEDIQSDRGVSPEELTIQLKILRETAVNIQTHGERADKIVVSMMSHAVGDQGFKQSTEINALVDEYSRLALQGFRAGNPDCTVQLVLDLDPNAGAVDLNASEIGQVATNLVSNALYALHDERGRRDEKSTPTVTIRTKRMSSDIEIVIEDNGPGIPETVLDRIFEPFFTTKPTNEGTGLGLSLSYEVVVDAHGGTLTAENNESGGATFMITLPIESDS